MIPLKDIVKIALVTTLFNFAFKSIYDIPGKIRLRNHLEYHQHIVDTCISKNNINTEKICNDSKDWIEAYKIEKQISILNK